MTRPGGSGALVLAGFEGTQADTAELQGLEALGVGGYILFGRNVTDPQQVHGLLADIREASRGRPLLFAVDQEGGRVARLRAPLTEWPPMAYLGATSDATVARDVGAAMGRELRALGFNLDFAPVLDVRYPETTDAIGDRSLGNDPARVSKLGRALIEGLQSEGLLACAKHFPGHGCVAADSHHELPYCSLEVDELEATDLKPFIEAIHGGVGTIMTAHVVYPALDATQPATLSYPVITDLLRDKLGFSGPILTDDLGMGAISETGAIGPAAVQAIRAGADGLLICRHIEAIREAVTHLDETCQTDPDFAARCAASKRRLETAAQAFPPRPEPATRLVEALGRAEHKALARRIRSGEDDEGAVDDPTAYDTGRA